MNYIDNCSAAVKMRCCLGNDFDLIIERTRKCWPSAKPFE